MLFAMIARRRRAALVRALLPAAVALLVAGCDKVPLTAPSESTITLFKTASSISSTGSTDIVATVIESSGTAVQNGTVVGFTTTLGRLEPSEARTQNGKVTVKLIADGRSGIAEVNAFSGGASTEEPLEVPIGSAAAETVTVRAEPARLGPGGGSTQIIALVRDEAGNGLSGTSVSFSATAGQLSSGTATTDGNGEARVTLTTNRETTVTVNVGGATDDVLIELDLAPSVTLSFTPAAPVADQTVNFTLTVNVPAGGLPIQQARIDFGDGDSRSLGALPNGATTVGHVYRNDGSYTVALTVTDSGGNSTTQRTVVVVLPAAPVTVSLTASDSTPNVGQIVVFTATASGGTGTTISRYEWTLGDGSTQSTTANTISHSYAGSGQKVVKVTATASGGQEGTAQLVVIVN